MHENNFEEKMSKFYDNISKKYPDAKLPARCRSVYFIQQEDKDGNIISENYGINHMTDEGMVLLVHGNTSAGTARYSDSLVVIPQSYDKFSISKSSVEESMQADDYAHYDSTTGFFYYVKALGKYVIPYDHEVHHQSEGSSMNYRINNLGIAGSQSSSTTYPYATLDNAYYSFSPIYDINGEPIDLEKVEHTKLTIYYYVAAGYRPDSLMSSLWNKGIYAFISPSDLNFAADSYMDAIGLARSFISYISGGNIRYGAVDGLTYDRYMWSLYEIDRHKDGENHPADHDLMAMRPTLNNHTITSRTGGSQEEISAVEAADSTINPHLSDSLCLSGTQIVDEQVNRFNAPYAFSAMTCYGGHTKSNLGSTNNLSGYHWVHKYFYASKELLSSSETIVSDNIYTNNFQSPSLLYNFGYIAKIHPLYAGGFIPAYDIDINYLKMYNVKTGDWDITVNTNNATAKDNYYAEFPIFGSLKIRGEITSGVTRSIEGLLFINVQPSVPISSFSGELASRVIYATDKYWDMSTWILIQDNSNIQQNARGCKYYILVGSTSTDDNDGISKSFFINRDRTDHAIVLSKYNYTLPIQWQSKITYYKRYGSSRWDLSGNANYGFSSYSNHWFVANNTLYYVDPLKNETNDATAYHEFPLYGPNDTPALMRSSFRYNGKYIMIPGLWNISNDPDLSTKKLSVRIYHSLDTITASTVSLPYSDILLDLEDTPGELTFNHNKMDIWFSESKSGYVIASYDDALNPVSVAFNFTTLDTTNNTITQIRLPNNAYHPVAIKMTSYVAYIDKNDITKVHIWNIATQDYVAMNVFEAGQTETIEFILGWKDHVYITTHNTASSTYDTHYYNISTTQGYQIRSNSSEMWNNMLVQRNSVITSTDSNYYKNLDYTRSFDNIEEFCNNDCYIIYPRLGTGLYNSSTGTTTYEYFPCIYFTESEPDKVHVLLSELMDSIFPCDRVMYGTIDSINDDKQIILPVIYCYGPGKIYRPMAIDIGRLIGEHEQLYISNNKSGYKNYDGIVDDRMSYIFTGRNRHGIDDGSIPTVYTSTSGSCTSFMWGNGAMYFIPDQITSATDKTTATNRIDWVPVEQLIPMRMSCNTKTLQFANNPKRIGKKNFSITITNSQ